MSRREKIEAMLADEPDDQFLRYSLASELIKEDEHERSLELLRGLMSDETPLVAAFLMAARHLVELDRIDEARTALRNGIEEARRQGENHVADEMSEFLDALGRR
ncbi:MAG: hypothetical protein H8E44_27915 [Planctomycetes bacterium]|nr:hypothetical protein [Planctomycetota bacterium]